MVTQGDLEFVPVTSDAHIAAVVALAQVIWPDHYTPIIGADQVAYMLATYHSRNAIADEIRHQGYRFFLAREQARDRGYFSVHPREDSLFLSKIYFLRAERGRGLGRRALAFIRDQAVQLGLDRIQLTVNKNNTGSIAAYERIGFQKTNSVVADIGNGYVMDDYVMAWEIGAP